MIVVIALITVVCFVRQSQKRNAVQSNMSTNVAYSITSKRIEVDETYTTYENPESNDYDSVPAHANAVYAPPKSPLADDVMYESVEVLPNFKHQTGPKSRNYFDKDHFIVTTHTNAAYKSSQPPLAVELEVIYDTALPDQQVGNIRNSSLKIKNVAYESSTFAVSPNPT